MHARRKEALELGKALAEAKRAAETAEAKAQAAREELWQQSTEMAEKDALIAQYKAKFGLS